MMRKKTALRIMIEQYLESNDHDDWLEIRYETKKDLNKIRSMAYSIDKNLKVVSDECNSTKVALIKKF